MVVGSLDVSTTSPTVARHAITAFVDGVLLKRGGHIPGGRLQRTLARFVPGGSRVRMRQALTNALAPWEHAKLRRCVARDGITRLHLGSGELPRQGWLNIDLYGVPVDVRLDLNRPLPLPDASVDAIFHEHLLEHLALDRAFTLTRECFRVLKPGGVLRIAVPDAERHLGWYSRGEVPPERTGHATPLMSVLQQFYGHGHRVMYDFQTLALLCHAVGFRRVERHAFGESRLEPAPDHEWRRWDSLYVEMVKDPAGSTTTNGPGSPS